MAELSTRDVWRRVSPGPEEQLPGKRYALVIGIDRYDSPLRSLTYAVKDATTIADRLGDQFGFEVRCLTDSNASAQVIWDILVQWGRETKPEDSVLIFFAGHGSNHPAEDRKKEGYLLPADANDDPNSWLPESEIVQYAKTMPARRVLLIFDACYAGTTFRQDIPRGAREDQVLKALVAGTEDQPVPDGGAGDHSIFTRAVLDGLDGWAQSGQRPDDLISADELIAYVRSEVPWRSRLRRHEQTPIGGPLQGCKTGEDFEFKPVKARLPAPLLRNIYSPNDEDRVAAAKQLGERVPSDTDEVIKQKANELIRLLSDDKVLEVRVTAAQALGTLGYPGGCQPLAALLHSDTATTELRAAAAFALGTLAQTATDIGLYDVTTCRRDVVQALIDALNSSDAAVLEAAKLGLGQIRESGHQLLAALQGASQPKKRQIVDALACLANKYPDDERAWPALSTIESQLLRRLYLARRRLRPQWPAIRRQALVLGLSGAIGLGLAYLVVLLVARWSSINLYGPAVLSYNLLPGALAGLGLAFMPHLARALARHLGKAVTVLGGVAGGLCLGIGMTLPNWFLGLGDSPLAWFLPGLISGPVLGLTLASLPGEPISPSEQTWTTPTWFIQIRRWRVIPFMMVAVVGALAFAVMRVPCSLSFCDVEPRWVEVVLWGCGGAILSTALAIGWSLSPSE